MAVEALVRRGGALKAQHLSAIIPTNRVALGTLPALTKVAFSSEYLFLISFIYILSN